MRLANVMTRVDRGGHVTVANAVNILPIVWRKVLGLSAFLKGIGEARGNSWPGQLGGEEEGGQVDVLPLHNLVL